MALNYIFTAIVLATGLLVRAGAEERQPCKPLHTDSVDKALLQRLHSPDSGDRIPLYDYAYDCLALAGSNIAAEAVVIPLSSSEGATVQASVIFP